MEQGLLRETLGIRAYFLGGTEVNIAENAERNTRQEGTLGMSLQLGKVSSRLDLLAEKRIKVGASLISSRSFHCFIRMH